MKITVRYKEDYGKQVEENGLWSEHFVEQITF